MKKILYLEGSCGIAGDMTVGALLALGASREKLERALAPLAAEGVRLEIGQGSSHGIAGCDFRVLLPEEHEHEHGHEHEHSHAAHPHRNPDAVNAVLDRCDMTDSARALAKKAFAIVAEAEAEAHGIPVNEVHFHEVGALDSIADIAGAAVLADDLGCGDCIVTGLSEGTGTIHCRHGELPVPVPAVLNIARRFSIPLRTEAVTGEMVTPTGIALAAALRTRTALPELRIVEKVGVGLGKRDFGRPNILRAMILRESVPAGEIIQMECNIDDSTGEELALALETLMAAGARDAHFIPCFMKKNRPAWLLCVLADAELVPELEKIVFRTTTAIGIRRFPVARTVMDRVVRTVRTPSGPVEVKHCSFDGIVRDYPEFESVKRAAELSGMSFRDVYCQAREAAENESAPGA